MEERGNVKEEEKFKSSGRYYVLVEIQHKNLICLQVIGKERSKSGERAMPGRRSYFRLLF